MQRALIAMLLLAFSGGAMAEGRKVSELATDALLDAGEEAVRALGAYSARLVKQERVDGELLPVQTLELVIREDPLAVRILYTGGPPKGRRVLYDATARKGELRVKEPGLLGVVGAVWLDVDSGMTRRDTNHPVTNLGLGPIIRLMKRDFEAAKAFGGLKRHDEGPDARGRHCLVFTAPESAKGLYAHKTRVCMDAKSLIPAVVEVHDKKGLLETYEWSEVKKVTVDANTFTPKAAGM